MSSHLFLIRNGHEFPSIRNVVRTQRIESNKCNVAIFKSIVRFLPSI